MFDLIPFRNRSRRDVVEREEDPFNSLVSDFFGDRMKVCSQTSWACPEEREDGIEF